MRKLSGPVKPNWMDSVPPSSPATMPRGTPKFTPQPEWIMGTRESTSTAFQLKRLMILMTWRPRFTPTKGAMTNSSSRKPAMIRRGRPNFCSASRKAFFFTPVVTECSI